MVVFGELPNRGKVHDVRKKPQGFYPSTVRTNTRLNNCLGFMTRTIAVQKL